jgi:hypothetical protein
MDNMEKVFVPSHDSAFRTIGDAVVIVHTGLNKIVRLNETGSAIWGMLDGRSVREISNGIAEQFEVDLEEAERDTLKFLDYLHERGFVTVQQREGRDE